jgi:hypothetical protein
MSDPRQARQGQCNRRTRAPESRGAPLTSRMMARGTSPGCALPLRAARCLLFWIRTPDAVPVFRQGSRTGY